MAAVFCAALFACGDGSRAGFDPNENNDSNDPLVTDGGAQDTGRSTHGNDAGTLGNDAATLGNDAGAQNCTPGGNQTGCACQIGQTQRCFGGDTWLADAGHDAGDSGGCGWGTQTCEQHGEFSRWGACSGITACVADAGPDAAYCNAGGSVYVNDISYGGGCPNGQCAICSGSSLAPGQCTPTFGLGGNFSARCAGTYEVCARVISNLGCTISDGAKICVSVTVPTDGASVKLPAFPPWGPLANACLSAVCPGGQPAGVFATALDVTGTTTSGVAVNRPGVVANIAPATCSDEGGGGGSGGGSF